MMADGEWISGNGTLRSATEELGRVEFKILVSRPSAANIGSGHGTIYGEPGTIFAGFESSETWIVRQSDGYEMGIVIQSANADGTASIVTTGDPGL